MKQPILHILCEGQTEDDFCTHVLRHYLRGYGVAVKSQILVTNRKRNLRGGLISFTQAKQDLELMFKQYRDNDYEEHWFSTMFDLYALPNDFPGVSFGAEDVYKKIEAIEKAMLTTIEVKRFIPYIQIHEFEALVFAGYRHFPKLFPDLEGKTRYLQKIMEEYNFEPERINSSVESSPSHRISDYLISCKHSYNKPKVGFAIAQFEGIDGLRQQCPHFDQWLQKLVNLNEN